MKKKTFLNKLNSD